MRLPALRSPAVVVLFLAACHPALPPSEPAPAPEHHHELHLPPAGPSVTVALDGEGREVVLADVPHETGKVPLVEVWKRAFPSVDPAPLRFDLTGSDGFHPASRPACAQPLMGAQIAKGWIDVGSHDVSFDEGVTVPGCYRVKGVVRMDGAR